MSCERQIPYAVMNYIESLVRNPNWSHGRNVEVVIVEVGGNRGYNWFPVEAGTERSLK